eukprot:11164483-Karenia_brevis.AAC.1
MSSDHGAPQAKVHQEVTSSPQTHMCYDSSKSGPGNDDWVLINHAEATAKQAINEARRPAVQGCKEKDVSKVDTFSTKEQWGSQWGDQDAEMSDSSPAI